MPRAITIALLLTSLLLQSLLWMLPAQRTQAADRLSHALVHSLDHGIAHHDHDTDPSLLLDSDTHNPAHSHANEGVQQHGLPVDNATAAAPALKGCPASIPDVAPPSAHPDGLLRPPCTLA
jgi:hypothetical protein